MKNNSLKSLLIIFSIAALIACGGGGGGGGGGETDGGGNGNGSGEPIAAEDISSIFYGTADFDSSSCRNTDSLSIYGTLEVIALSDQSLSATAYFSLGESDGSTYEETFTLDGIFSTTGSISGSFTEQLNFNELMFSNGTGSFTGQYNSTDGQLDINFNGNDVTGNVCSYTGSISLGDASFITKLIPSGNIYVSDYSSGGEIEPFSSPGAVIDIEPINYDQSIVHETSSIIQPSPRGLALDMNNDLIVVGDGNGYVDGSNEFVHMFRINMTTGVYDPILIGRYHFLYDVVVAQDNMIYATQQATELSITQANGIIKVDPSTGLAEIFSTDGIIGSAHGIAIDLNGDFLVTTNTGIKKVDYETKEQTVVSSGGYFENLTDIEVASNGDIYVLSVDYAYGAGRLIRVNPLTGEQTIVSTGGWLSYPTGLAFDENGDIIVLNGRTGSGIVFRVDATTGEQTFISGGSYIELITGVVYAP